MIYTAILRAWTVLDGDTLGGCTFDLGWNVMLVNQSIRLEGVDAPEVHELRQRPAGEVVRKWVEAWMLRALIGDDGILRVRSRSLAADKYGRCLGDVVPAEGFSLVTDLLQAGIVKLYRGGKKAPWTDQELADVLARCATP